MQLKSRFEIYHNLVVAVKLKRHLQNVAMRVKSRFEISQNAAENSIKNSQLHK